MAGSVRSLLAPWIGGVSAPSVPGGYRSLLAFWMGGVTALASTPAPEPVPTTRAGGRRRLRPTPGQWRPMPLLDQPVEDEEALFMLRMI